MNHILTKFPEDELGFLRLSLILYFLFATYASSYNPKNEDEYDLSEHPQFIANLNFTADKYGPQVQLKKNGKTKNSNQKNIILKTHKLI